MFLVAYSVGQQAPREASIAEATYYTFLNIIRTSPANFLPADAWHGLVCSVQYRFGSSTIPIPIPIPISTYIPIPHLVLGRMIRMDRQGHRPLRSYSLLRRDLGQQAERRIP